MNHSCIFNFRTFESRRACALNKCELIFTSESRSQVAEVTAASAVEAVAVTDLHERFRCRRVVRVDCVNTEKVKKYYH